MSKTVSELSKELGLSPQYLNRVLNRNQLGNKIGNKKLISGSDEKLLISILKGDKKEKTETKSETSETGSETKTETSFDTNLSILENQLIQKDNEINRLHDLLDHNQQLLLNEQKKTQLMLENKSESEKEPEDWKSEKIKIQKDLEAYQKAFTDAERRADNNYAYAEEREKMFYLAVGVSAILLVLLLFLGWFYFFG
ncbi:TPA: mobilization protein [Streptococcus agalactiae]|nr:mobilization protein [Streptococcus agalactiae]